MNASRTVLAGLGAISAAAGGAKSRASPSSDGLRKRGSQESL
ncbi:hypothetical protein ACHMW9_14060 [Mesorhizobium terrae]